MARKRTTVYIEESLLRAAKAAAARSGKREYEVFEEALQRHLAFGGTVERIWTGIGQNDAPTEDEAAAIAAEELASARSPSGVDGGFSLDESLADLNLTHDDLNNAE